MSKTRLKKELQNLAAPRLRDLIVELYDARKEAREYLDFFVDPDIDKMRTRYRAAVIKEMSRVVRRHARPRMTRIRKLLKDFASFNAGDEYLGELMVLVAVMGCRVAGGSRLKDATQKALVKHVGETLAFIDAHELTERHLPRIIEAVELMRPADDAGEELKRALRETVAGYRASL